jgi:hypothetical protein
MQSDVYHLFDDAKLPDFISGLRELLAMASIEAQRSPRSTRTDVTLLLKKLSARKTPVEQLLQDPFAWEVMHLAWLDLHAHKSLESFRGARFVSREFDRLYKNPRKVELLVRHFRARIAEFDKLSPRQQSDWYFIADSKIEISTKQMLYPYLQRGKPTSVETYVVRNIAALYELASGKRFAVSSLDAASPIDSRIASKARYEGPGIRFACAVCRALSLSAFMAFDKNRPHNPYRQNGIKPRYLDPKTEKHGFIHSTDPIDDKLVARKIGNTWKNDEKLKGPKPLSVYR